MSRSKQHVVLGLLPTHLRAAYSPLLMLTASYTTGRLKNMFSISFTFFDSNASSKPPESVPSEGNSSKVKEDGDPMCPSCKKRLSNNTIIFGNVFTTSLGRPAADALSQISYEALRPRNVQNVRRQPCPAIETMCCMRHTAERERRARTEKRR